MEWIKVSEKLPNANERIICTCVREDGSRYVTTDLWYVTTDYCDCACDGFYEWDSYYQEDVLFDGQVIAWMPFDALTPYQG